ncbi:alcohol dehydrogenase [Longibacter salinarum]|uniref:Alcohol dehydrogenase n=1 Tax=Longibacter salinarum TaxID=1850348 RepID=A0A2A8CW70_9BACT|nr:quinone oxidoreductase family protein [Longibacter salinarum]PEN12850.1 alcohol dehydrogenase [Longibacter salinarum]
MAKTYRKLIATKLTTNFRDAAELVEEDVPELKPHEVLIRNVYAGINATDVNITAGRYQPGAKPPIDLGAEAAGIVEKVGSEVRHLSPGDAVVTSTLGGGYREYNVVRASNALPVDEPTPEALSIMVSGLTASIALEEVGDMSSGETVLVTAAAGGTGQYAVQLAKRAGNHVIGTCGNERKMELLKELGCDHPINYNEEDVRDVLRSEYPSGVNLVYEGVGGELFDTCVDALARYGRLLSIGYVSEYKGGAEKVSSERIYTKLLPKSASIRGFFLPHFAESFADHMSRLMKLVNSGALQVSIDQSTFEGIESIPDAVEYLHTGESRGKVVVKL